jgi:hypothetical protein
MTQTPGQLDIFIYKGDDFNPIYTLSDGCGNLIDLTGSSVAMNMWTQADYPTPFESLTTENGGITLTDKNGVLSVINPYISAVNTAMITVICGFYHLDITAPGGQVNRYLQGQVTVVL